MNMEQWDEAPIGSVCGPGEYDYQYRRYWRFIVQEAQFDAFGAGTRGSERFCGGKLHCCSMHAETPTTDPCECCGMDEDLIEGDFNQDFWSDSLILNNILDSVRTQMKNEPARITIENPPVLHEDMLKAVHGGTMLHQGVRRTWLLLNKLFPGHRIPMKKVQEFLDDCRHKMRDNLQPFTRVLKPPHARNAQHTLLLHIVGHHH